MKCGFLCHQLGNQIFGLVDRDLIRDGPLYPAIPLDVLVDLYALFTHEQFRIAIRHFSCAHIYMTVKRLICSSIQKIVRVPRLTSPA
jgi:hypothetical protein